MRRIYIWGILCIEPAHTRTAFFETSYTIPPPRNAMYFIMLSFSARQMHII